MSQDMAQTDGEPEYEEGDEFIDFTAEEAGTWVVERVEWEQRWKQGEGAWAYYLRAKNGDNTRHKLESGLEWDIKHGKLDKAPEGDPSERDRDLESDGGYPSFSDASIAQRARTTSAFTRSRGAVSRRTRRG